MPFLIRARAIYDRGNTVAAAIALVEGLKRDPYHDEALDWLFDLYCEEINHTGLEDDIAAALDAHPDTEGVYAELFDRLMLCGKERFVRRLDRARYEAALRTGRPWRPWNEVLAEEPPVEAPLAQVATPAPAMAYAATSSPVVQAIGASPPIVSPPVGAAPPMAPPIPHQHALRNDPRVSRASAPPLASPVPRTPSMRRTPVHSPSGWAEEVHPALMAQVNQRAARPVKPKLRRRGSRSMQTEEPQDSYFSPVAGELPDPDAVFALEEVASGGHGRPSQSLWGASGGARRPPKSAEETGTRRKLWKGAAILAVLVLGGLAVSRLATVADRRQAVEGASAATERFQPALLQQAEMRLSEAAIADPDSLEIDGRLRWTRSLRRYVTSAQASLNGFPEEPPMAPPAERSAWFVGAQILGALSEGHSEAALGLAGGLEAAREDTGSFPESLALWLDAEIRVARGDLPGALEAYTKSAEEDFLPGIIGAIDVQMRRGDIDGARENLTRLEGVALDHPAVAVGKAALGQLAALLKDPEGAELRESETLTRDQLIGASADKRLAAWVVLAAPGFARKRDIAPDAATHPALGLVYARELLGAGRVEEAAGLDHESTADLKEAYKAVFAGGYARAGRPDLALAHVPAPKQGGEIGAEMFVRNAPKDALVRAALLADSGQFDDSRMLLARLIAHPELGPEARVIALQMHMAEGRVDDVRRHIDRLKDNRGALVAGAALEFYQNKPGSAVSSLGPSTAASLPKANEAPNLRRFELRIRLLALAALDRREQIDSLLEGVDVSPALRARVIGKQKNSALLDQLDAFGPTRIEDLLDMAVAMLDAGRPKGAAKAARKILVQVPSHTEAHQLLGRAMVKAGRTGDALRHLEEASKGRGDAPSSGLARAEALLNAGSTVKAIKELGGYLDHNPRDPRALRLIGEAYLGSARITMGRRDMDQRVLRLSPIKDKEAYGVANLQLTRLYAASREARKCGTYLRKAREALGDRPEVVLVTGELALKRGDRKSAMKIFERVTQMPNPPLRAFLELGRVALVREKREVAKGALERYLRDAPDGKAATWARSRVDELEGQ